MDLENEPQASHGLSDPSVVLLHARAMMRQASRWPVPSDQSSAFLACAQKVDRLLKLAPESLNGALATAEGAQLILSAIGHMEALTRSTAVPPHSVGEVEEVAMKLARLYGQFCGQPLQRPIDRYVRETAGDAAAPRAAGPAVVAEVEAMHAVLQRLALLQPGDRVNSHDVNEIEKILGRIETRKRQRPEADAEFAQQPSMKL